MTFMFFGTFQTASTERLVLKVKTKSYRLSLISSIIKDIPENGAHGGAVGSTPFRVALFY